MKVLKKGLLRSGNLFLQKSDFKRKTYENPNILQADRGGGCWRSSLFSRLGHHCSHPESVEKIRGTSKNDSRLTKVNFFLKKNSPEGRTSLKWKNVES